MSIPIEQKSNALSDQGHVQMETPIASLNTLLE